MIALLLEDMLLDLGHEVVGVAHNLQAGLKLAQDKAGDYDMAILDVNLAGDRSFPIARLLQASGTPFMFATGYGTLGLEDGFKDVVTLKKPFQESELETAVNQALSR